MRTFEEGIRAYPKAVASYYKRLVAGKVPITPGERVVTARHAAIQ